MLSVLRHPDGRRLFPALLQSRLGTGAGYVALLLIAYHRLHSPWAVSLVLLADFVPGIALSPLCGALADRWSRRGLVVGADLLSAAAFVALATTGSFAATVGLALAAGTGSALAAPTLGAALSDAFGAEQRPAVGALRSLVQGLGITIGPALAAGLMLLVSPSLVLVINGATFAVSAAVVATVDLGRPPPREPGAGSLRADVREGVRLAARVPGLLTLLALDAATVLAGAVINVAEPILAIGPLHAGATGYSAMVSAYGAGMIAASCWASRLGACVATLRRWWLAGLMIVAAGLIASALAPALWVALAAFALTGAGNALAFTHRRIVQEVTPPAILGRVLGMQGFAVNAAFVGASLAAGGLTAVLGSRLTFAAAGVGVLVVAAVAVRSLPAGAPQPADAEPGALLIAGAETGV